MKRIKFLFQFYFSFTREPDMETSRRPTYRTQCHRVKTLTELETDLRALIVATPICRKAFTPKNRFNSTLSWRSTAGRRCDPAHFIAERPCP